MRKSELKLCQGQRGLALLVLAVLVSLVSIMVYLKSMSVTELRNEQIKSSGKALVEAKQALIAYALTRADYSPGEFGFLPCPDLNEDFTEGGSHGNCGVVSLSRIGLFPWASLETGLMQTGSGSCFWYAVSGDYKNSSVEQDMLNEDTNGLFRLFDANDNLIIGAQPEDRIVALILDPQQPVASQSRSFDDSSLCGLDYNVTHFLEGNGSKNNAVLTGTADVIDDFIRANSTSEKHSPPFNDRIEIITREELWRVVTSRPDFVANADSKMRNLTEALAMCIAGYGNNAFNRRLPRPAAVDFGGADYRDDANYDDTMAAHLGRYPHTVDDSDTDLGTYTNPLPPYDELPNAPVPGESVLFDKGFCSSLTVTGGAVVNLKTDSGSEYYNLWKNWKDHFFYAVSDYYAPTDSADTALPSCTGGNCVTVNGVEYAAVVIFSNSRTGGQIRNAPISGDADTKKSLANYIEVTNPAGDGTGDYTPTGNDIVYCITDTDPVTVAVASCP